MMRYIFFLLFLSSSLFAQEVLSPLKSNPREIKSDFLKNKASISLPFFDDFSSLDISTNLWIGNSTLINNNYPINPPTIGVVTFDGLDSMGFAYDINMVNNSGYADQLLSQEIDMSNIDTAYLLFYHQPQGHGDDPQVQDSLILEFLSDSLGFKSWKKVWSVAGSTLKEFKKNALMVFEQEFLHSTFQFRFRNIATLSGNFDHWHVDYVKFDTFNSSCLLYTSPSPRDRG